MHIQNVECDASFETEEDHAEALNAPGHLGLVELRDALFQHINNKL